MVVDPPHFWQFESNDLIALLASFFNAGVYLSLKILRKTNDALAIVLTNYSVATLSMIVPITYVAVMPSSLEWLLLGLLGLIGLIANILMTIGFKYSPAGISASMALISVPLMTASGLVFFNETLSISNSIGICLVLLSLFIITTRQ